MLALSRLPEAKAQHFRSCAAWTSRSNIVRLVKLHHTGRQHSEGRLAPIRLQLSSGPMEVINNTPASGAISPPASTPLPATRAFFAAPIFTSHYHMDMHSPVWPRS